MAERRGVLVQTKTNGNGAHHGAPLRETELVLRPIEVPAPTAPVAVNAGTARAPRYLALSRWARDRKVRTRLVALVGVLLVAWMSCIGVAVAGLESARSAANESTMRFTMYRQLQRAERSFFIDDDQTNMAVAVAFLPKSPASAALLSATVKQARAAEREMMQTLGVLASMARPGGVYSAKGQQIATQLTTAVRQYNAMSAQVDAYLAQDRLTDALTIVGGGNNAVSSQVERGFNALKAIATADVVAAKVAIGHSVSGAMTLLIALVAAGVAVAIALAGWLVRSITKPVRVLAGTLAAVTAGDLSARAEVDSNDELGQLAHDLNGAIAAQANAAEEVALQGAVSAAAAADYEAAADVIAEINGAETLDQARHGLTATLLGHFSPLYVGYFTLRRETGELERFEESGPLAARFATTVLPPSSQAAEVLARRSPLFVSNLSEAADSRSQTALAAGAASAAWLPIVVDGVAGALVECYFAEPMPDKRRRALAQLPDGYASRVSRILRQDEERAAQAELAAKVDEILAAVNQAAAGDLTVEVSVGGEDAIGRVGEQLSRLFANLRHKIASIGEDSSGLAGAAEELSATATQLSAGSEETSSQANLVSDTSVGVSESVQTVAAAAEELTASIREIARNAAEASQVATEAAEVAAATNITVNKLGESSAEIGNVIKVITSIAQQTNLLALNATIEAARAGEAGKGFAVVANEVKDLARETATATEDISAKIEAIQADTAGAVQAIGKIGEIIAKINELQATIAAAVEEQTATTNEIARSVTHAASGSSEITTSIASVAEAAQSGATGAADTLRAAAELARLAAQLQSLVGEFRY